MTALVVTAQTYARWRASTLGRLTEQIEVNLVSNLTGPLAGKRVLDAGAGDGTYALEVARRGARVTALDPDPQMLDAAAHRAAALLPGATPASGCAANWQTSSHRRDCESSPCAPLFSFRRARPRPRRWRRSTVC